MTAPADGKQIPEIMRRTMENLRFIDCQKHFGAKVFEVTQLLNSFLGAPAIPWEKYVVILNQQDIEPDSYWVSITNELSPNSNPIKIGQLIGRLRNAVLHGNFELRPEHPNEIASIVLWTAKRRKRTWQATLKLEDLRRALNEFVAIAKRLE